MSTSQWIKRLSGHAGELYVAAELSKRGILSTLLPDNFPDNDILIGKKDGPSIGYIQVKSCHPDRALTFRLSSKDERWENSANNEYVVFVWLGSPRTNSAPTYWIAKKQEIGRFCKENRPLNPKNKERRFAPNKESYLCNNLWPVRLKEAWYNNWAIFSEYIQDK